MISAHKVVSVEKTEPYGQFVAKCSCGEQSDECDTAAIAKRNLSIGCKGGFRP